MPIALVPNVGIPPYNWQEEVLVDNAAKLQPLVVTHASGQVTLVAMKAATKGKSEVNCVLGTVTYWEPAGTLYCEIKLDVSYPPALETPELGDAPRLFLMKQFGVDNPIPKYVPTKMVKVHAGVASHTRVQLRALPTKTPP